jgi:hypothetical protein
MNEEWNAMYVHVSPTKIWNETNPSCSPKDKEDEKLVQWCDKQRTLKQQRRLSPNRIRVLEMLPKWQWKVGDSTPFFTDLRKKIKLFNIKTVEELNMYSKDLGTENIDIPTYYAGEFTSYDDLLSSKLVVPAHVSVVLTLISRLSYYRTISVVGRVDFIELIRHKGILEGLASGKRRVLFVIVSDGDNVEKLATEWCNSYLDHLNKIIFVGNARTMNNISVPGDTYEFIKKTICGVTIITAFEKICALLT